MRSSSPARWTAPRFPRRYRDADIFTLAPWEEAFGNVFAEALASGLPIVGSTVGGIPEVVEHGKNGFLVPPREPRALAAAIRHLADHPEIRADIGRWNRAQAEANLSWARVTTRYLSALQRCAAPRPRAPRRSPSCPRAPGDRGPSGDRARALGRLAPHARGQGGAPRLAGCPAPATRDPRVRVGAAVPAALRSPPPPSAPHPRHRRPRADPLHRQGGDAPARARRGCSRGATMRTRCSRCAPAASSGEPVHHPPHLAGGQAPVSPPAPCAPRLRREAPRSDRGGGRRRPAPGGRPEAGSAARCGRSGFTSGS